MSDQAYRNVFDESADYNSYLVIWSGSDQKSVEFD